MTRIKRAGPSVLVIALIAGLIGYVIGCNRGQREQDTQARAQETTTTNDGGQKAVESKTEQTNRGVARRSPMGTVPDRDTYFPGTEPLNPDEMRIGERSP